MCLTIAVGGGRQVIDLDAIGIDVRERLLRSVGEEPRPQHVVSLYERVPGALDLQGQRYPCEGIDAQIGLEIRIQDDRAFGRQLFQDFNNRLRRR